MTKEVHQTRSRKQRAYKNAISALDARSARGDGPLSEVPRHPHPAHNLEDWRGTGELVLDGRAAHVPTYYTGEVINPELGHRVLIVNGYPIRFRAVVNRGRQTGPWSALSAQSTR